MRRLPVFTFLSIAILICSGHLSADLVSVDSRNLAFISSNAVASGPNSVFQPANGFDGENNSNGINGSVFDLTIQDPSNWVVDILDVDDISQVNLFQKVGSVTDHGVQNFSITFYDGDNLTGNVLLTESFTATLNPNNTAEVFNLTSTVFNPESFELSVTSSFGDESLAEFSEITFEGTNSVPEPSSAAFGLVVTTLICSRRRRYRS